MQGESKGCFAFCPKTRKSWGQPFSGADRRGRTSSWGSAMKVSHETVTEVSLEVMIAKNGFMKTLHKKKGCLTVAVGNRSRNRCIYERN